MDVPQIPSQTQVGHVRLQVSNLERALHFYSGLLGFKVIQQDQAAAGLSASGAGPGQIWLLAQPEARPRPLRTTGLFHIAVRYPDREALSLALIHLVEARWPLQGFSDHQVSEAIYLADPDGNGVELYADRPRDLWPRQGDHIAMTTDPLDVDGLLRLTEGEAWPGIHPETDIGHVHLRVSDLRRAEAFYHGLLGLDVTQRDYPGALFLSAGGYHHHVGLNIWAGIGLPPPPPDAVGLRAFALRLPGRQDLLPLAARARSAALAPVNWRSYPGLVGFALRDPDQLEVELLADQTDLSHDQLEALKQEVIGEAGVL